ncbi:MAG TPA: penicillin-binding transpeptidase domain-containing protein [Gaiellaceae bacterium]|nr:penicillin-binding transpeptidase domain-containing protein [Gaiellaceae bacterium]
MRIGGLAVVVGVALSLLVLRAWSIQILHGPQYKTQAAHQAFRTVDLEGPRGAIVDDHGRLLANTTGHVVIVADPGTLGAFDTHGWHPSRAGDSILRRFASLTHVPMHTLVVRIQRAVVQSPFAPAVVVPHPQNGLAFYLDERPADYPGMKVTAIPSRSYPQGNFGSEFLGLLGEVSKSQLGSTRYAHATAGELVGESGVEATYDHLLNPGFVPAHVRVDSLGRIAGALEVPKGKALPTLKLTIDARIQRAATAAVQHGIQLSQGLGYHPTGGSAVVMNPYTGGIYALASTPTYNQIAAANDPTYNAKLYTDPRNLLVNRAIAGVYPTGSTFKPIIAEAALSAGIITPETSLLCSGSFDLGGYVFHNVEAGVYSSMTLPTALEQSCDTWFYRLGDRIYTSDPSKQGILIQQWAHKFGLGSTPPIDLTGAASGYVPAPGKTFEKLEGFPWTEGQTINLAIGQGALQVSPLQLAVAYATIANGGTVVTPHVAAGEVRGGVTKLFHYKPQRKLKLTDVDAIREGLYLAAHNPAGTSAAVFANYPVPVAGKTGTAEAPPGNDHSWYASWAPAGHPEVVVVCMIEHGGFGAEAAAPCAKDIYNAFFHIKPTTP